MRSSLTISFVEATTCSQFTNFETSLAVYDTCPHTGGSLIATEDLADKVDNPLMPGQQVGEQTCSILRVKASEPTLFWLV